MLVPACLLFGIGILGAADIHLFHTRAQRIRLHPGARSELVTHFLRGPTYFALFLLIPNFTFHGWALMGILALLAVDLGISLADFWLEPASREELGGLPRGEYVLHVVIAMLFGALVAAVLYESAGRFEAETAVSWVRDGVPVALRVALALMAPLVLWTGIGDLRALLRLPRTSG